MCVGGGWGGECNARPARPREKGPVQLVRDLDLVFSHQPLRPCRVRDHRVVTNMVRKRAESAARCLGCQEHANICMCTMGVGEDVNVRSWWCLLVLSSTCTESWASESMRMVLGNPTLWDVENDPLRLCRYA